jgi:cytochrome c553
VACLFHCAIVGLSMPRIALLVLLACGVCVPLEAAPPNPVAVAPPPRVALDFARDVQPILAKHCVSCHGPDKQRGGLRLDRSTDALKGGDSGTAIVPGKSADSLLLKKILLEDASERMPPNRDPLSANDVRILRAWIDAGAVWPAETATATRHWAFQPVVRPPVPATIDTRVRNTVDHFILAKLSDKGLSLNPEADRRTLIRRLKFDLLGLPPTPEEVDAFAKDNSPDAYEQLVEKFLASPHYGERWARHWLDAVRFAESNGFETNQLRPNAYHYRDYVIRALNDDKPYDQFVREQLAGDTLNADAATGFLVGGAWDAVKSPDETLTLNQRADELHDMIGTTGSAFLGLTVACSRCHAHKFDPIPQTDYYQFKAVFAGVQHGERSLRASNDATIAKEREKLREQLSEVETKLLALEPLADPVATEVRRSAVNPRMNTERFKPVKAKFVRFAIFETTGAEPCIDELEVYSSGAKPANVALVSGGAKATSSGNYPGSPIHRLEFVNDGKVGNNRSWISNKVGRGWVEIELAEVTVIDRVVWGRDRDGQFIDRLATRYRIDVSLDRETWSVVASSDDRAAYNEKATAPATPVGLNVTERGQWAKLTQQANDLRKKLAELTRNQMVYAGRMTTPEPTFRLHRGDATQKREPVGPGVLSEIGPKFAIPATATDPERRAALAKWITDPAHPLTARVIVNRLWQHHFGVGIVDTPSDFGRNGGTPSHAELLDWLASELVARKWSLKAVHRLIVTSATYRQSSASNAAGILKDAQARLLWRYPARRMEAEPLRDAILFASGKLDTAMGGPGFDLFEPNGNYVKVYTPKKEFGPAEFRRMIYQQKPRMQLDDTFGVFDCPDAGQIAPKRNVSVTPLQALNLLNSSFVMQQAGFFAERVKRDAGNDVATQVKRAFAIAFQRMPSDKELSAATKLVQQHGLAALCRALLNANEFLFID